MPAPSGKTTIVDSLSSRRPGQVFYESPEDVHTVSRNASKTKPAKFVVFLSKMKEHRFSLPFISFGTLNFSDETILHKAIFLTWRHV